MMAAPVGAAIPPGPVSPPPGGFPTVVRRP